MTDPTDPACGGPTPWRPWGWGASMSAQEMAEQRRQWRRGWRRYVFPGVWLVLLAQTIGGVSKHTSGWASAVGYALVAIFAFSYLQALPAAWAANQRRFWTLFAIMVAACGLTTLFAHEDAFVMCLYIAVLAVGALGRYAWAAVAALAGIAVLVPPVVPSWHAKFDPSLAVSIILVGLAMYGFFGIIRTNQALSDARAEVARLAAENERTRIARDLHDLLGHSLTTITVKAGLARRLAERHDERATTEIAEVEELSRRSLADVRAAVAGHRDVTLAGELATAREVLRAAGIVAELPGSVDVVDPSLSELFGWVTREGVTNVIRHARAAHCVISVDRTWIEIVDDGRGAIAGAGNGLTGLRERVEAAGGTAQIGPAPHRGWRLRVDVPLDSKPPAPEPVREAPTMSA